MKDTILTWLFPNPKKETENIALNYLEKHGNEYWITADTHIKAFTKELEENISTDRNIEGKVNIPPFKVEGKYQNDSNNKTTEILRGEVKERVQSIVNNYQISALNEIIKKMSQYSFNDPQKKYYLIIDDLDKNWMPDDALYLELLKSLLYTVKEINQKLTGVKIIIALRTNIYHRIFKKSMINEPQREKWNDVISEINWKKSEIKEFVDKRLSVVFRGKYTKDPPTIEKILPHSKRKSQENSFDYLLNRTFYRPRDVLSFLNHCIEETDGSLRFSWSNIRNAEIEYSKERLNSIIDEWKNSYFGLHALFNMLGEKGPRFCYMDITDSDIDKILNQKSVNECKWLKELFEGYCEDKFNLTDIKNEFLKALYTSGLVGLKDKINNRVYYSFEKSLEGIMIGQEFNNDAIFEIHKSFWKALGINKID